MSLTSSNSSSSYPPVLQGFGFVDSRANEAWSYNGVDPNFYKSQYINAGSDLLLWYNGPVDGYVIGTSGSNIIDYNELDTPIGQYKVASVSPVLDGVISDYVHSSSSVSTEQETTSSTEQQTSSSSSSRSTEQQTSSSSSSSEQRTSSSSSSHSSNSSSSDSSSAFIECPQDVWFSMNVLETNAEVTTVQIVAISNRFEVCDIAIDYSAIPNTWQTDTALVAEIADICQGNCLYGIPCSPTGSTTVIQWSHLANGIALGSYCELRIRSLPMRIIHSWSGLVSTSESIGEQRNTVGVPIAHQVVGLDLLGRAMCVDASRFFVLNSDGSVLFAVTGLTSPRWGLQKRDDERYLILDSTGIVKECDSTGTVFHTVIVDVSTINNFAYDERTASLLYSTNTTATEVLWTPPVFPVVQWTTSGFTTAAGVCYDLDTPSTVAVADSGANLVTIYDRLTSTVSTISSVEVGGIPVAIQSPYCVNSLGGGRISIVESQGKSQVFSGSPSTHPSLLRANGMGLSEERNLVFAPILRAV